MSSNNMSSKPNLTQTINFKGCETEYSAEIVAKEVIVNCSHGDHQSGSSKVKLKNVVDYNWELKYYIGQLIACHVDGKIYAYTIKPKGQQGMLRVINIENNQRVLIKAKSGAFQDISFAFSPQVTLGCVDEEGNLYVYSIDEENENLNYKLLLHVCHPQEGLVSNYRVIWCPYVPSYGENSDTLDDPAKLLALLNGHKAEIWDVCIVNSSHGAGPIGPSENCDGFVLVEGHVMNIIDASFSPDGTALATASLDGYVKFFQVYINEQAKPRCLHEWQPHDGRALSCLLFLDNVKLVTSVVFWKCVITGTNFNAELKIWSCESWACVQTIKFDPSPHSIIPNLFFKVVMDMTAEYLLMSDINNRILYILHVQKNDDSLSLVTISMISEFLLPSSVLSFDIVSIDTTNVRCGSSEELYEFSEDYDDNITATAIRMMVVQPKSLQECIVTFKPEPVLPSNIKSVYGNVCEESENEIVLPEVEELPKLDDLQSSVTLLIQQQTSQHLNLMTPDDFTSPVVSLSPIKPSLVDLSSPKNEALMDFEPTIKDNCASGNSSPSREVQKILASNNTSFNYDDLTNIDHNDTDDVKKDETSEVNKKDGWPELPFIKAIEIEESRHNLNDENGSINYRLLSLEMVINKQNEQIKTLQQEIKVQNGKKSTNELDIRKIFTEELTTAMKKHQSQTNKLIENFAKDSKKKELDQMDKFVTNLLQTLTKLISESMQTVMVTEIKKTLQPPVLAIFEQLQLQLDMHYSQKLNTIDQLLKTNVSKMFTNKAFSETLSTSIISVIKPSLENCYKEMVETALIPSWEKICNAMFQQIHSTFTKGTKEYTASVETYMERQRKMQEKGKDVLTEIQQVSESMQVSADRLSTTVTDEMQKQIDTSFHRLQEKLSFVISDLVKEQIKLGFGAHAAVLEDSVVNAVRSRAVTPSPHLIDTQTQIAHLNFLISKGYIEAAFQQALSASANASDLSFVLHMCERVKVQDVFTGSACILPEHVLLSLIQQLAADLSHHTEIKHRYLQEAILNLDPTSENIREHVPIVLRELAKQLNNFVSTNSGSKNTSDMKMLLMATKALLN